MIVDTSALIALLLGERDAAEIASKLARAKARNPPTRMSAANWLEGAMVAESREGRSGADDYDELVSMAGIEILSVTREHARLARIAFRRYGRGSGSPARLNFGDCLAYAVAVALDAPLLFKGDDFTHTDVRRA